MGDIKILSLVEAFTKAKKSFGGGSQPLSLISSFRKLAIFDSKMSQTKDEMRTVSKSVKIPVYTQASETTYDLDWADLATLDLSKFEDYNGKRELAAQLHNAIQHIGRQPKMYYHQDINDHQASST